MRLSTTTLSQYAEWHYAECHDLLIVVLDVIVLSVIVLGIIMLSLMVSFCPFLDAYHHSRTSVPPDR
jgi:hypothetical protein